MMVDIFIVLFTLVSGTTMAQEVASTGTYVPDPRYDPIIDEFLDKYKNENNCLDAVYHNLVPTKQGTLRLVGWANVTGLDRAKRIAPVQRRVRSNGDLDLLTAFQFQQVSGVVYALSSIPERNSSSAGTHPLNVTTPNVVVNFVLPKDVTHNSSATYHMAEEPEYNEGIKNLMTAAGGGSVSGIPTTGNIVNAVVRQKFPRCYEPIFHALLPVLAKVPA